ncbi:MULTISPECIES: Ni/Fe-hydrogenase, b-type cytochrome subunit [unclassified Flavobacterium]|jgi:Ni/Fe-hydrogenase 1 B-type cytochrome subunit|uniref:Ni/Fe-hydrogenase, b-type cytochrome subunit n=1 Tax=unclassified Flavobacterium TaxID=196869 RepID=UPI0025C47DF3|nr:MULTISPECIES: Ni/Fe-hydrogenase, b-type cytochrome subunit [unclassified Flavobacterium]
MSIQDFKRAYVWQLPVRIFHWVNALAITVLIITGLMISHPPGIISGNEASSQFWFGYIREIHFMSAYLMVAVLIMRVYWAFKGNKYANRKVFVPFNKEGLSNGWYTLKYDIFLQNEKRYNYKKSIHVGHNNIAAVSYLVMFILAIVMIITGFGLYSANSTWFLPKMFAWVPEFLGGDMNTRVLHHLTMWGFILFVLIHVYLVLYHDWLEGRGEASAMISGYKFVRAERIKKEAEKK